MMSKMADLLIDIEDLYWAGFEAPAIATKLNVPLDIVQQAVNEIQAEADAAYDEERDQFNSDLEADADVLASAGWGVDEDYVMDNDYYD